MKRWQVASTTTEEWGHVRVVLDPPGITPQDVTFLRGAPTEINGWSSQDPFGDETCQVTFPQITPADELGVGDLIGFQDWANVDLYYVNPEGGSTRIWEGMIASMDFETNEDGSNLTISCIGALYQADLYVRSERHLVTPRRHEQHIYNEFAHRGKAMRCKPVIFEFPPNWPHQRENGSNWTTHETRESGSWGRPLTQWIQDLLATMVTDDDKQWTLLKRTGRQPVLQLRDEENNHATISCMQPGVSLSLSYDLTQTVNAIYGEGQDIGGVKWGNGTIITRGRDISQTYYEPIAYDPAVHPYKLADPNPQLDPSKVRVEVHYTFGNLEQSKAIESAQKILERDKEAGWMGTITLKADPQEISRFELMAGMNITLQHFAGTGQEGMFFHIAGVEVDMTNLSVDLQVDTKFRDRLTLEEALDRNRDSKKPSKLLQINRESGRIDDTRERWDYRMGSGFIPHNSAAMWNNTESSFRGAFPYPALFTSYPPSSNESFYVRVRANNSERKNRWTVVPVRVGQFGSVHLSEFVALNASGQIVPVSFHVGVYAHEVTWNHMPFDGNGPSPFIENAFRSGDGISGNLGPDNSLIMGWGDWEQKGGHWPGLESEGHPPTGLLRDTATWQYNHPEGHNTVWVAFYAEHSSVLYFHGRFYKGVE